MRRTVQLKLMTDGDQERFFLDTLDLSRQCFNAVSEWGWANDTKNGVTLHHATYRPFREQHPRLPSQLVVSARMKATEALKSAFARRRKGKTASCPHARRGSVRYDARSFSIDLDARIVSLASTGGRQRVRFRSHGQAERWLRAMREAGGKTDTAEIHCCPSGWYMTLVLDIPVPEAVPHPGGVRRIRGVDLGINRPAVTSDMIVTGAEPDDDVTGRETHRAFLGERRWKDIENRYFRQIRSLQTKGTKSARRKLKRLRHRRKRFRLDCDRRLAKAAVRGLGPGDILVVENLRGIRERTRQRGRRSRRRHHGWSYDQLRGCMEAAAEAAGVNVVGVDPRHTSQTCSACGHVHRRNRTSQARFHCRSCDYRCDADVNAARNVARKHLREYQAHGDLEAVTPPGRNGDTVRLPVGGPPPASAGHAAPACVNRPDAAE